MARRSNSLITLASQLPWWGALLLGLTLYVFVAHVLPRTVTGPFGQALQPTFVLAGYLLAGVCVVGAVLGLALRLRQKLLYRSQRSLDQIRALGWDDFEHLMAEAFRREGFTSNVTEAGPDGGVDLILAKDGKRWFVQCKQWRTRSVGVKPVRELAGVASVAGADGAIFVCSGSYTSEAQAFARRAGVRLIDGNNLAAMMHLEQEGISDASIPSTCPRCGNNLVQRIARNGARAGASFLGCASFPKCRYTRDT
jgi:restriction system protein